MRKGGVQLDGMGSLRRTHACGSVTSPLIGEEVVLAGWVHRRRDHGGLLVGRRRDLGLEDDLDEPGAVAQIHEQELAMIALAVNPAREARGPARVGRAQDAASVAAIAMKGACGAGPVVRHGRKPRVFDWRAKGTEAPEMSRGGGAR